MDFSSKDRPLMADPFTFFWFQMVRVNIVIGSGQTNQFLLIRRLFHSQLLLLLLLFLRLLFFAV